MPVIDRAAQFAPFAALSGYGDAIKETARQTSAKMDLSEDEKYELDVKLKSLQNRAAKSPNVMVTFFVADDKKQGGEYRTVTGRVKIIDPYRRIMVLWDGEHIPLQDIVELHPAAN